MGIMSPALSLSLHKQPVANAAKAIWKQEDHMT